MKSILGIGNALTDILAVFPDETMLREYHLPPGSMQHVDLETGDSIWAKLKEVGVKYVPGGSAANTITCTSIFGMPSGFIGKIGNDELGHLYRSTLEQSGVKTTLLTGTKGSGRAMCFITGANAERTFADYMGAALELVPEDLKPEFFEGYDYFHIEGYLVQNQDLIRKAVQMAKEAGCIISIDMASYNVVESNEAFFHNLVEKYIDIVFANESEARAYTKKEPREALDELAEQCRIAIVKVGKDGSMVKAGDEYHFIEPWPAATIDATGAGDTYAAGFLYAHSLGMPLRVCGEVGSIIAAKVVEVIGTKIDIPRWKAAKEEIRSLIAAVKGQETPATGLSI
ncbi:MAG: adenosine kinase [Candidatus Cryptobacteroides sp.]